MSESLAVGIAISLGFSLLSFMVGIIVGAAIKLLTRHHRPMTAHDRMILDRVNGD